jgi:hypothetical protein
MNEKAQVQVTFNWVYVLIAGAVILLFFAGIVVRQQTASEQILVTDVVRILESIFVSAGVSENTKFYISTFNLADYTLFFDCEDGVGRYGIEGGSQPVENTIHPIFAPLRMRSPGLVLWSLPYHLPFKVIDLLMVTSVNTKYYLWGDVGFVTEFLKATEANPEKPETQVNRVEINSLSEIEPKGDVQVRIVDLDGLITSVDFPAGLKTMADDKVSAVSFVGDGMMYYSKQGLSWVAETNVPIPLTSLGGERDAAKYAAIFAGNAETYQCNMKKAFKRIPLLNEVYEKKLNEMLKHYTAHPESGCKNNLEILEPNVKTAFATYKATARTCASYAEAISTGISCEGLLDAALKLRTSNEDLHESGDCLTLY